VKPIVQAPHAILSTPAQPVTDYGTPFRKLIADMKDTLAKARNPKGVGLAAPQIGEPYCVFIIKPKESVPIRVFINPEIIRRSRKFTDGVPERDNKLEGCLSIKDLWGKVHRSTAVTLRYTDERGGTHTEEFTGFPATIIQHETDHLNGILFTQRVLEQKNTLYHVTKDEEGKDVLNKVEI